MRTLIHPANRDARPVKLKPSHGLASRAAAAPRAVDPEPHGSAFLFPPGSGFAFIFPPEFGANRKKLKKKTEKCKEVSNKW